MIGSTKYLQIIPADRWFYEQPISFGAATYCVACWALTTDGDVVGLIAVDTNATTTNNVPRLVEPPSVGGRYFQADAAPKA